MSIQVNDKIPEGTLHVMGAEGPEPLSTNDIFPGKKVVLFAVPGAFTPGCSVTHLPGFVVQADTIKGKGVDMIVCLSVNDAFVMNAWGKSQNLENVKLIPDGSGEFTRKMGMLVAKDNLGFGLRSWRYAAVVKDGVVEAWFEEPGYSDNCESDPYGESSPQNILAALTGKATERSAA